MNWQSAAEFWAMGGYGGFVWSSFGVCLLVFVLELLSVHRRNTRAKQSAREHTLARHETATPSAGPIFRSRD